MAADWLSLLVLVLVKRTVTVTSDVSSRWETVFNSVCHSNHVTSFRFHLINLMKCSLCSLSCHWWRKRVILRMKSWKGDRCTTWTCPPQVCWTSHQSRKSSQTIHEVKTGDPGDEAQPFLHCRWQLFLPSLTISHIEMNQSSQTDNIFPWNIAHRRLQESWLPAEFCKIPDGQKYCFTCLCCR